MVSPASLPPRRPHQLFVVIVHLPAATTGSHWYVVPFAWPRRCLTTCPSQARHRRHLSHSRVPSFPSPLTFSTHARHNARARMPHSHRRHLSSRIPSFPFPFALSHHTRLNARTSTLFPSTPSKCCHLSLLTHRCYAPWLRQRLLPSPISHLSHVSSQSHQYSLSTFHQRLPSLYCIT